MHCEHCFSESPNTSPRCIQCGKAFFSNEGITQQTVKVKSKGIFGSLGWIAGLAVGWYSGIFILMLMACSYAMLWLGKKILRPDAAVYVSAIAFQAGQTLLILGFMVALPFFTTVPIRFDLFLIFDAVIPIAGLVWLILKPGFKPVIFLTLFQVCALVMNGLNFSAMSVGNSDHKALATHILWRILALFMMWNSYLSTKGNCAHSPDFSS